MGSRSAAESRAWGGDSRGAGVGRPLVWNACAVLPGRIAGKSVPPSGDYAPPNSSSSVKSSTSSATDVVWNNPFFSLSVTQSAA